MVIEYISEDFKSKQEMPGIRMIDRGWAIKHSGKKMFQ